jgi:hypothetical protein
MIFNNSDQTTSEPREIPVYLSSKLLKHLAGSLLLLTAAGCTSTRTPSTRALSPPETSILEQLETAIQPWMDTPYRFGGDSRHGIDCSAFADRIYRQVFDRQLPRTTEAQATTGHRIDRRDLRPGDLVFFKPPGRQHHVGIYLSENRFTHASTTNGVTVSSLQSPYWTRTYWMARRPSGTGPGAVSSSTPNPTSSSDSPDRSARGNAGW